MLEKNDIHLDQIKMNLKNTIEHQGQKLEAMGVKNDFQNCIEALSSPTLSKDKLTIECELQELKVDETFIKEFKQF